MPDLANKTEKLASALYLITSFFDDHEPIKWRLRILSTNLVSEEIRDKSITTREILSLLSVARTAGLISDVNHDILLRELSKLEDTKKSLSLLFSPDINIAEKALSRTQEIDYIKDNIHERKVIDKPVLKEFGAVSVKKNSRQSIIISILKRKKEIVIKDVTPLISGCSEKTIQRELSSMVEKGLLKKVGEKRWSRYSLA